MTDDEEELTPEQMVEAIERLCAEGAYDEAGLMASVLAAALAGEEVEPLLGGRLLTALAELARSEGDLDAAAEHVESALRMLEASGADGEPRLAGALHAAALVALDRGQVEQAMPLLERAAALVENRPDDRAEHALVLTTLGEVSLHVGEPEAAERLFARVLERLEQAEPTSDGEADWLNAIIGKAFLGLGGAAAQRGRKAEAADYLGRATEFLDAGLGPGHPALVEALERIVALYRAIGDEPAAVLAEEELAAARAAVDEG